MTRPEPPWWAEARRLRAEGWKVLAIAVYFNKDESTVQHALHDYVRRQRALARHKWWKRLVADPKRHAEHLARERANHEKKERRKAKRPSRAKKIPLVREKMLDTSGAGGKLARDGAHHGPLNTPET